MRLLPKEQDWTAYAWLVYLAYFCALPFFVPASRWDIVATVAGTAAALPLYFWGYWLKDRRILWVVGAFALLGTLLCGINPAGSVFFVYAASYLGKIFEPRIAYRYLAALLTLVAVDAWTLQWSPYVWIPGVVFSLLIGSVIIQQFQKKRLTQSLLVAQDQVRHLAQVAERERIARDLHDLLGHTLSLIVLKSELASRLTDSDPARAAVEIRDVERISRDALAQVRSAVRGYRSDFESELRQARQALEAAGVRVETTVQPTRLTAAQESVFAMALREAVTNVVRHAHASVCRLTLRRDGTYCELEVADDGLGGLLQEGSGLSGMRERVEALGGILERDGSRGTLLRIRVPV